jgi:hypothetical protein
MAGKQHVTVGFHGNRYAHNKKGTVENSAFYWVCPRAIEQAQTRQLIKLRM